MLAITCDFVLNLRSWLLWILCADIEVVIFYRSNRIGRLDVITLKLPENIASIVKYYFDV